MDVLVKLELADFTAEDMDALLVAVERSAYPLNAQHILLDIAQGDAEGWKNEEDGSIIITKRMQRAGVMQLFIVAFSNNVDVEALVEIARVSGCTSIGMIGKEGEHYGDFGLSPIYTYYCKELEEGEEE